MHLYLKFSWHIFYYYTSETINELLENVMILFELNYKYFEVSFIKTFLKEAIQSYFNN